MQLDADKQEEPTLDIEWLQLVLMARQVGLTKDDIRSFLQESQVEMKG